MNNKVIVKLIVPEIDEEYELYLPINKKVGNIINLINKAICEMTDGEYKYSESNQLYNYYTKEKYMSDVLLADTNIRNGTYLILIS